MQQNLNELIYQSIVCFTPREARWAISTPGAAFKILKVFRPKSEDGTALQSHFIKRNVYLLKSHKNSAMLSPHYTQAVTFLKGKSVCLIQDLLWDYHVWGTDVKFLNLILGPQCPTQMKKPGNSSNAVELSHVLFSFFFFFLGKDSWISSLHETDIVLKHESTMLQKMEAQFPGAVVPVIYE